MLTPAMIVGAMKMDQACGSGRDCRCDPFRDCTCGVRPPRHVGTFVPAHEKPERDETIPVSRR